MSSGVAGGMKGVCFAKLVMEVAAFLPRFTSRVFKRTIPVFI